MQVTEKDLYALIGEQAMIIRVQEQMIARLEAELAASGHASAGRDASGAARAARGSANGSAARGSITTTG